MFAIVRTGGKQYRVAAGDKIVVEKMAGEAGDKITLDDVLLAAELPLHHRDPFDRLMIAQARQRGLAIVTRDRIFGDYGVPIVAA